ncbi:hypothetical protein MNBD_UNCLBAC01-494 [hydrothermal vent metagenome]|uniref:Uncharacterized protein n=1 Tax=hydrothermal vent metagenome TaxID=652676 RepID=A0A3B1DND1_9ZZZZ
MFSVIKKYLVFLIIIYIATFSIAHKYEHANINKHIHEFHKNNLNDHVHLENEHNAFDAQDSHHPSLHKHLDDLFFRSARQKKTESRLFVSQIFIPQNAFLDISRFNVFKNLESYLQTTQYSSPFIFRNPPLLI